jgi:hypothetical protein
LQRGRTVASGSANVPRTILDRVADLIDHLRRVRQVADVFGVPSTAQSVRAVAQRALEHDDEEVRVLAGRLLAELERAPGVRRR